MNELIVEVVHNWSRNYVFRVAAKRDDAGNWKGYFWADCVARDEFSGIPDDQIFSYIQENRIRWIETLNTRFNKL